MEKTQITDEQWDLEIKPGNGLFNLHLSDVWAYRDLLLLLVRRDFCGLLQTDHPRPVVVLYTAHFHHHYLYFCIWQFGRYLNRWFTAAAILYSRHHRLELFLRLPNQNQYRIQG